MSLTLADRVDRLDRALELDALHRQPRGAVVVDRAGGLAGGEQVLAVAGDRDRREVQLRALVHVQHRGDPQPGGAGGREVERGVAVEVGGDAVGERTRVAAAYLRRFPFAAALWHGETDPVRIGVNPGTHGFFRLTPTRMYFMDNEHHPEGREEVPVSTALVLPPPAAPPAVIIPPSAPPGPAAHR